VRRGVALALAAGLALASQASGPLAAEEIPAGIFHPETFTLDNGLEVVVIPNRRAPVVSHWLWYRVGSADSPPGQSGIAHFLEHLMFKGTQEVPAGQFSRIVARHGGNDNALTGQDFTAYHQTIAREHLELVMRIEADRMTGALFPPDEVATELPVIVEERRQRVDNSPSGRLGEALNAAQYLHHPYRLPVIGWMHEIEAYTREDAKAFYEAHYAPNNAILVVTGDVDAKELRPLAEAIYGVIPAREVSPRVRVQEPPQQAARRVVLVDPRAGQPSLSRSYLAPSYGSPGGVHAYALEVLADLFGRGGTSRLYRSLVIEQGLAVSAGAWYSGSSLDATTFRLYATPRPGVGIEALEAALDAEIQALLADGVTQAEVERAQRRMVAEVVYAVDSLGAAARIFGIAMTTGQAAADVEAWPTRISLVDAEAVVAAARHVLQREQSVTGVLLPSQPGPSG
jgi:zinc protease